MQPVEDEDPLIDFPSDSDDYWYELEYNRSAKDLRRYLGALKPSDVRMESVLYIAGRRQLRSFIPEFIEKSLDESFPIGARSEAADSLASVVRPSDASNMAVVEAIDRLWESGHPHLRVFALIAQHVIAKPRALEWAQSIIDSENPHEQEVHQAKYFLEGGE